MKLIHSMSALLGMTLLGSCEAVDLLASLPVITADPLDFRSDSTTRRLTARITRNGARMEQTGLSVTCEVSLRLTPNRATTPVVIAATQGEGTRWACNLPSSLEIRPNQVVQSQWLVKSGTTPLADSGRSDQMPDCPTPDRAMIELQERVRSPFRRDLTHREIIDAGFVPSHGFTSYEGIGVAFVRGEERPNLIAAAAGAKADFGPPVPTEPDILLFRPNENGRDVTDVSPPDNPYTLVGWGYAQTIKGASPRAPSGAPAAGSPGTVQARPQLPCIPHHQWFIHSSGTSFADGRFVPSPTRPRHVDGSWQSNLWYIHLFINFSDPDGPPTAAITKPGGQTLPGSFVYPDSFYHPVAYD